MAKEVTAIYPGSFDPVTNGHVDIIGRSRGIFDRVIVAVLVNIEKTPFFTTDERLEMLREVTGKWDNVQIETFQGLLVNYAIAQKAQVILRGIRAVTDYEYEFQMALMNRRMQPGIETVFMVPAEEYTYLSSKLVKEIFLLGGSVEGIVPSVVEDFLNKKKTKTG
ncbi:MAG: pantetheine-phosphate adenylyltransferase [Acidobacteriota bacterium]